MTDSTPESTEPKRQTSSQIVPEVNTIGTPVTHRFDPPLEHRPYEEIVQEIKVAMAAIRARQFGRKKVT